MPKNRKHSKRTEDQLRARRLVAARKRKAAERHEATAARFRAEAEALEGEAS